MTQSTKSSSKSFFHIPQIRPSLKSSAQNQLHLLMRKRSILERDVSLLLALEEVGILTRHQIQRLFFPSQRTAARRLKFLYDSFLLDAGSDAWFRHVKDHVDLVQLNPLDSSSVRSTLQYGLEKSFTYTPALVGRLIISKEKGIDIRDIDFDPNRYDSLYPSILTLHDLWISEAYVQMRLHLQNFELPFNWMNEANSIIFDRDDLTDDIVRPDATCSTELMREGKSFSFNWHFEMDRGSTVWDKKVQQYWRAILFGDWHKHGFDYFPVVLCVVPDRLKSKAIEQISGAVAEIKNNISSSSQRRHESDMFENHLDFSVTSWSEFIANPITSWHSIKRQEVYSIIGLARKTHLL